MNKTSSVGRVAALWRYPVKSMQGEMIAQAWCDQRGLLGDRCLALFDCATETVASAKHPRAWGRLLQCQARFVAEPVPDQALPAIQITFPDSRTVRSDDSHVQHILCVNCSSVGCVFVLQKSGKDVVAKHAPPLCEP